MPGMDRTKVLRNGAIYDMDKKRIVAVKPELAETNTQITSDNAGAMQARRHEIKRQRLIDGANRIAAEGGDYDGTDYDFIEAIGEAQMRIALNVDSVKSTDAARFLVTEAGLSDKQQAQTPAETASDILAAIARLAADVFDNYSYRNHEVLDAETSAETMDGNDSAAQAIEAGGDDGG